MRAILDANEFVDQGLEDQPCRLAIDRMVVGDEDPEGGVETARAIRLQPGPNRDTPLMALTGAVSEPEIALCREAGFASVAAKPIQVREVIAAMNQALSRTAQAG